MKVRYLVAAALALAIGSTAYLGYQNRSVTTKVASMEQLKKDIEASKTTVLVLVRGNDEVSKKTAEYFNQTAKNLKGKAQFLEVDVEKVAELKEMTVPSVVLIDTAVGAQVTFTGPAESQDQMQKAFSNIIAQINDMKAILGL